MKKASKGETMAEDSPDKEATLGVEDQSSDTDSDTKSTETSPDEGVKLPEEFQKSAHTFVSGLDTDAKINYVRDCLSEQQSSMQADKAGTDTYSAEDMPK